MTLFGSIAALTRTAAAADQPTTIYRDEFGIPHIFAPTLEDAAFAVGYAQAEDRLEELLKNYRRASGTMAEVFGPEFFDPTSRQRVMRHAEVSQARYQRDQPQDARRDRGVSKRHQAVHERASRAGSVVGRSRSSRGTWSRSGAISSGTGRWARPPATSNAPASTFGPLTYRGSNEMLIAPKRTAMNAAIAIIDPHVPVVRRHAVLRGADLHARVQRRGRLDPGRSSPDPGTQPLLLGRHDHRRPRYVRHLRGRDQPVQPASSIATTASGAISRSESEIDQRQERRQGRAAGGHACYSHHGPIVARKNGKAYAMAIPYANEVGLSDQCFR